MVVTILLYLFIFHGRVMNSYAIFVILLIVSFACNDNPSSDDNRKGTCGSPKINSCSGDPCSYLQIYDTYGNLVNEGSGQGTGNLYWNGKDCNGDSVPCGNYTAKTTVRAYGQVTQFSSNIMIKGPDSIDKYGRAACDSLRRSCAGNYVEGTGTYINSSGSVESDIVCICCE